MKNHILKLSTLIFLLLFSLVSCKKETDMDDNNDPVVESQATIDAATAADKTEDEAAYRMSPTTPISTCPTITWTVPRDSFPNTVLIDFGNGCTGRHGHRYYGQVTVVLSGPYFLEGSVRTVSSDNLQIDGTHLTFTAVVTNQGLDSANNLHWTMDVDVTRQQGNNGVTTVWSADRTRTLTGGLETPDDPLDDNYEITGTSSGTLRNQREFTSVITSPLVKRGDCRWIVAGVEVFTIEGRTGERILDYGDGTCDDKGILTLPNGETLEVTLTPPWK